MGSEVGYFLALGSQGPEVRRIHGILAAYGCVVKEDEIVARLYGWSTDKAVRELQKRWGMEVDGKWEL